MVRFYLNLQKTNYDNMKTRTLLTVVALCLFLTAAAGEQAALRDSILRQITGAKKPQKQIIITALGAKGDGRTDCKKAFDRAMRKAAKAGGAHIVVPEGTYLINGPIHLVSNVCLELQEGATLMFSPTPSHYLPAVKTSWEGTFLWNYSPFIYGYGLHDISIIGKGTIDGNAGSTFATYNCKNITIEDVFITNSPFWCIHLLQSENIVCRGIRYDAKLVNNDGIDPEMSRNILIEDIHFNNGDDNVAIKSGRDNDGWSAATPSENIIIRNCHFKGLHAVVIGSEMSAGVRNVIVEDCDYAGYCKRGIFVKTNPDRGGFVENLFVRNCVFDEVEDLFYVTSMYAGEGMDNTHFSDVRNIYVDGIECRKARQAGIVLQGTKAKPIKNVSLRNVNIAEVRNAISFDNTEGVTMDDCHLGGKAGVPSQVAPKDNLFK